MIKNHCPLLHMQRDISWLLLSIFPSPSRVPQHYGSVAHKIEARAKSKDYSIERH